MSPVKAEFDISKVASIARIELAESEMRKIEKDLVGILEAFGELEKAGADCEPSFQPVSLRNVMRDDSVEKSLSQEESLSLTPHKEKGFFKGPRII